MIHFILLVSATSWFFGVFQAEVPFPDPPPDVTETAMLAPANEPGERVIITGTMFRADGKTPYVGLVMYLYQTDARGLYHNADRNQQRPRLRGWVKTNTRGRYTIHTIKPGSYPGSRNPAHIHAIVRPPGEQGKWIDDFLFDGDPYLREQDVRRYANKGSFSCIVKMTKEQDGTLRGERNIVVP